MVSWQFSPNNNDSLTDVLEFRLYLSNSQTIRIIASFDKWTFAPNNHNESETGFDLTWAQIAHYRKPVSPRRAQLRPFVNQITLNRAIVNVLVDAKMVS